MKPERLSILKSLRHAALVLAAISLVFITCGCGTPGVQVPGSGWQAQRYGQYNIVWASTNISFPDEMQELDNTWRQVISDGYVTTDASGQGKVNRGACNAFVFQSGSGAFKQEYYSACSKSTTCTTTLVNCTGITVVTLPGNITFKGSTITIVVNNPMETVMVMSTDGMAVVTPSDSSMPAFEVPAAQGAYAVTSKSREQAQAFFGFGPGEIRDLAAFVVPIENSGQIQQVQSANLISVHQGLPVIPLPTPYTLQLSWLDEKYDDIRLSQAIVLGAPLPPILDKLFPGILVYFSTQGERIDLRSIDYDPARSMQLLAEAGYPQGQEMVLAYDESIPGTQELAATIADSLNQNGQISMSLQAVNLFKDENGLNELISTAGPPVLLLSGI
jgi:hypothetical protein